MGMYTEIGVVNRREASADAIINEIREATTRRHTALLADPPTDGDAKPETIFGGVPWSWRLLLRNRPLDVWMHEQDVRRAVGRPGGMDTAPAQHTAEYLAESLGYVLAKKARRPRRHHARARDGGQRAVRVRGRRGRPRATDRPAGRADGHAADGPRVVRPARRRPLRRGARRRHGRGRPGARRPHRRCHGRPPRDRHDRRLAARRHPGPGRAHDRGHRHLARRARPVHRARAGPPRRARGPGRADARASSTRPRRRSGRRSRTPSSSSSRWTWPAWSPYAARARPRTELGPIDVLVNNAGVMGTSRAVTADGLDLQLATNHFGPFLLTGLLLPQLLASKDATVVTVSSIMHRVARSAPTLGRAAARALPQVAGLRAVQAGQPALHPRARPPRPREGPAAQGARGAPRLRGHAPGGQRPVRPRRRRHRLDPRRDGQGGLAAGRARRLAGADGRDRRPPRLDVRRTRAGWAR